MIGPSSSHNDGDFQLVSAVEIVIQKYNTEKKLVYGKSLKAMSIKLAAFIWFAMHTSLNLFLKD